MYIRIDAGGGGEPNIVILFASNFSGLNDGIQIQSDSCDEMSIIHKIVGRAHLRFAQGTRLGKIKSTKMRT